MSARDFTKGSRRSRPICGYFHRPSPGAPRSFRGDARNADIARKESARHTGKPVARYTSSHGRRGPRGHASARCAAARRHVTGSRRYFGASGGTRPACGPCRRPPAAHGPRKSRDACTACRARAGAGRRPGDRRPGRGEAVELRGYVGQFRSVVVRWLRLWLSLLLLLLLLLLCRCARSPVDAGLRPSRRLQVVHVCVRFTWNMSASAPSSAPAPRPTSEPVSASVSTATYTSASTALHLLLLRPSPVQHRCALPQWLMSPCC